MLLFNEPLDVPINHQFTENLIPNITQLSSSWELAILGKHKELCSFGKPQGDCLWWQRLISFISSYVNFSPCSAVDRLLTPSLISLEKDPSWDSERRSPSQNNENWGTYSEKYQGSKWGSLMIKFCNQLDKAQHLLT